MVDDGIGWMMSEMIVWTKLYCRLEGYRPIWASNPLTLDPEATVFTIHSSWC